VRYRHLPALAATVLLSAGLAACGGTRQQTGPADSGPALPEADVLLVTIDTLRADALGFAGNAEAETPLLDRLAAAGRVFDDAHAHNVVTLPSHANILTGTYPYQHGVRDNSGFVLPESVPTLAALLKEAGYATGAFVAAYPLDSKFGLDRGFDTYDDSFPRGSNPDEFVVAERRGDQVVAPALAWWNQRRGQRRFLWVHLYDPHAGYAPPEPFASRHRDNLYLGEVAAADSFLAPLLSPLLDGREPPALVIVTSDHGEALGEHGEQTHGLFAYEPTLKVPLVVWGPGVTPARDGRPARHIDIAPTILQALGLTVPAALAGRSLLADPVAGETTYFEALSTNLNRGWAPLRGLLKDGKKWIDLPLPELYDLPTDPGERANLVAEERRVGAALRQALPAESVWPPPRGEISAEEEARLRSLGYFSGSAEAKAAYTADDDPKKLIALDQKLHQVIDLYTRGRYAEAAELAREVVAARPGMAEGHEHLALALRQLERHDEAIEVLRAALASGVERSSVRRQLGLALSERGRAAEAIAVLEPLATGDAAATADTATLNALGIALSEAGRHADALAVLQRSIAEAPQDPKGSENLGITLLRMDRPAEARDALRRALAINPALPIAWNTLGVALYRLEGPAAALDAWEKAVAIDPSQYDALFNIGLVAAEAGRAAQARRALTRFVETAPRGRWGADVRKAQHLLAQLGS